MNIGLATKPRLADVMKVVCEGEGLTPAEIKSQSRKWGISHPRQVGMAIARMATTASYPQIAQYFGKFDHTTAIYAYRKVTAMAAADPKVAARLDAYRAQVVALVRARTPDVPAEQAGDVAEANALLCAGDSSDWFPPSPRPVRLPTPKRVATAIDQADWLQFGGEVAA